MTEALEPAGWTIYGTRCRCRCHRFPGIRHFMACCSSEKRDTPMTKSILSEQREADEELCEQLLGKAFWYTSDLPTDAQVIAAQAAACIRARNEALQEACHERDGLLAKVERSKLGWSGASSGTPIGAYWAIMTPLPGEYGWWKWDEDRGRWMPLPTPPGEK